MRYRPCDELVEVLAPAFAPCAMLGRACTDSAKLDPTNGYVPRGFIGALGSLEDVEVVIIVAEPGDPLEGQRHDYKGDPVLDIDTVCEEAYRVLDNPVGRGRQFHRNVRHLLDLIYPRMPLPDQLRRVWITESVLCSAPVESGNIPREIEDACVDRYLAPQLALLPERPHVPFGNKARNRADRHGLAGGTPRFVALAPPGARRESREEAARWIRDALRPTQV